MVCKQRVWLLFITFTHFLCPQCLKKRRTTCLMRSSVKCECFEFMKTTFINIRDVVDVLFVSVLSYLYFFGPAVKM